MFSGGGYAPVDDRGAEPVRLRCDSRLPSRGPQNHTPRMRREILLSLLGILVVGAEGTYPTAVS